MALKKKISCIVMIMQAHARYNNDYNYVHTNFRIVFFHSYDYESLNFKYQHKLGYLDLVVLINYCIVLKISLNS